LAAVAKAFRIDEPLKDFLESGLACIVGTASNDGWPRIVYCWGARASGGGNRLDVYLDRVRSEPTLANLQENGHIAVTVGDPVSYRSVQIKGAFVEWAYPTPDEEVWVKNSREAFIVRTSLVGDDPGLVRNLWFDEVVRITLAVEQGFDQTPGPGAGQPL
jgi:hypothetical protein